MRLGMLDRFRDTLLAIDDLVLTTHQRPDGDAIGSEIGLARYLARLGKQVTILNADLPPGNLDWLAEPNAVTLYRGTIEQRARVVNAGGVVVVDTNAAHRLGDLARPIQQCLGPKLLIDHHPDPETWFDDQYVVSSASSTGELIYELIVGHDPDLIDKDTAVALYTAIMTDTGSFRFNSVTPRVHEIIADLLRRGDFNPEPVHLAIYNNRPLSTLRLLGYALESVRLSYGGKVGTMVVTQRMLQRARAGIDETEGFVDYVLSIEGVEVAVIFLDLRRNVKASFRSSGSVAVNAWARHFGGGGHRNAAGAYMEGTIDQLVDEVIAAAPAFLDLEGDPVPDIDIRAEDF